MCPVRPRKLYAQWLDPPDCNRAFVIAVAATELECPECQRPTGCAVDGDPLVMQRCDALKDVSHIIGTVHVIGPSRNVHVSVMLMIGMHDAEQYRLGLSGD